MLFLLHPLKDTVDAACAGCTSAAALSAVLPSVISVTTLAALHQILGVHGLNVEVVVNAEDDSISTSSVCLHRSEHRYSVCVPGSPQ